MKELGADPASFEAVNATINYARNRVVLFGLLDPRSEISVGETISHELVHALLEQLGERWAARTLDRVSKTAGDPTRRGGI